MKHPRTAANLLHDLALELVEMTRGAKQDALASGSDYDRGRHFALYEAISLLSQQTVAFGLTLKDIGLDGLDIDQELL